jgi:dTDP-4-dehydrorhamnose reductase
LKQIQYKNIVITGAAGLLGGNLCYLFQQHGYKVTGVYNIRRINIPGVIMIPIDALKDHTQKIDCIIHCAAKTDVDASERDPNDAYTVNVTLTEQVIEVANRHNALLIHISTDAVYQESAQQKNEQAALNPLSVYARTKLTAEEKVNAGALSFYIIRTNLFGFNILNKKSLAEWVVANLEANKEINGFFDVLFSPIFVNDLFSALLQLLTANNKKINTVFNIGAVNGISKYDFACMVAEAFDLKKELIKYSSVADFGFIAKRSVNSVMDCTAFQNSFDYTLPGIETCVQHFKEIYATGYPDQLKSFNINDQYVNG